MRNILALLAAGILTVDSLCASVCPPIWSCFPIYEQPELIFDAGMGYREDNLRWKLAGPCDSPSTMTADRWHELRMVQGYFDAHYVSCHNYYTRVSGAYGQIAKGEYRESDYLCDGTRGEMLRIEANAGKGYVYDIEGGFGYQWTSNGGRAVMSPLIGYSYHQQRLFAYDAEVVINKYDPDEIGPIDGRNIYTTRWQGLWIGIDAAVMVECNVTLYGTLEYHWAQYRAFGDYELRRNIVRDLPVQIEGFDRDSFLQNFRHRAHGNGLVATAGASYNFCENWFFGIEFTYQNWQTEKGKHYTTALVEEFDPEFQTDILVPYPVSLHLHPVRWSSWGVVGEFTWRY